MDKANKQTRTTIVETTDFTFSEVKSCWEEAEVNELLKSGKWRLLTGGLAHRDLAGYCAKPCYILGRMK
jgi:hypothetical protein